MQGEEHDPAALLQIDASSTSDSDSDGDDGEGQDDGEGLVRLSGEHDLLVL